MANVLILELRVGGVSGPPGERVFPLFVAKPRTARLCDSGAKRLIGGAFRGRRLGGSRAVTRRQAVTGLRSVWLSLQTDAAYR